MKGIECNFVLVGHVKAGKERARQQLLLQGCHVKEDNEGMGSLVVGDQYVLVVWIATQLYDLLRRETPALTSQAHQPARSYHTPIPADQHERFPGELSPLVLSL